MCGNKTLPIKEGQGRCFENLLPKQLLVPLRSNTKQRAAEWIGEDTNHGQWHKTFVTLNTSQTCTSFAISEIKRNLCNLREKSNKRKIFKYICLVFFAFFVLAQL